MASYFRGTQTGRRRSSRLIPEPFFVHSDLTTGVQIVDLVAYIIAWNVRFREMRRVPRREELDGLGRRVRRLSYKGAGPPGFAGGLQVWGFYLIHDLFTRQQQGREAY
jgi:hypothetical protein